MMNFVPPLDMFTNVVAVILYIFKMYDQIDSQKLYQRI